MTDNRAGEMRWQAERRAAMETSLSYWSAKHKRRHSSTDSAASPVPVDVGGVDETDTELVERMPLGSIVWAGLEPVEFIAMFPEWERRNDVARINVAVSRRRCRQIKYELLDNVRYVFAGWSQRGASGHR